MARREIGLMGYVGEAVVHQWLQQRHPSHEHMIVSQIIPDDVPRSGGGYLDFGVVTGNSVDAVYEVKSQDYILDGELPRINKALLRIWNGQSKPTRYELQDGRAYEGRRDTEAYLILLVAPNERGRDRIGFGNLGRIILFRDIWADLGDSLSVDRIMTELQGDVPKVLGILRAPTQGRRVTEDFVRQRGRVT